MYIGIRYVGIRIRYADLKDKARVVLEYAFAEGKKPPQMKDELIKHAKKKGVELSPDSVYIYQKNHTGYVYFTYTDSLVIPFPKKVVYFYFEVNESLSGE
ncbi:hypothetical protein DRQ18_05925 [bacterium]|nr:MAG: hypothetical protein DRQ18_05925 [bacterium]